MATQTETPVETAAKAVETQTQTVAKAARSVAKTGTRQAKKTRAAAKRKPVRAQRKTATRPAVRATRPERTTEVNFQPNAFAAFGAFPAAAGFEKLVNETASRGEDAAKRSRQAAEELADIARGNVDAIVEASRIAAGGVQSIAQKAIAKSRDSVERTAETVRSMAEAKNPSDLLQLQAEFVRGAFDRFVSDSSTLTESVVKLAGESFQPISSRATRNVERFNDIIA
jgi:phasin family protein